MDPIGGDLQRPLDVPLGALRYGDDRLGPLGGRRDERVVGQRQLAPGVFLEDQRDHVVDGHDGRKERHQRGGEVRAVQQVDLLGLARFEQADLLPPGLLDVLPQPGQGAHHLDVAEAIRQMRPGDGVGSPKAWTEQDVRVLLVVRVEPLEQVEQVLPAAGGRFLEEERVDADAHGRSGREATIDGQQLLRRAPPGEARGPFEAAAAEVRSERLVEDQQFESGGQGVRVVGIDL